MSGWRQKQAAARLVAGIDLLLNGGLADQVDLAEVVIRLAVELGRSIGSELVIHERARLLRELNPGPPPLEVYQ